MGTCWHIIAAKLSIGDEDGKEKKVYNLTQLRRNHRKKPNKKAGKKKPRPCDDDFEETIINAAPDSSIKNKIEISDIQTLPVSSTQRSALKRPRIANSVGKTSSKRLRFDPLINIDTKDNNEITETEDYHLSKQLMKRITTSIMSTVKIQHLIKRT